MNVSDQGRTRLRKMSATGVPDGATGVTSGMAPRCRPLEEPADRPRRRNRIITEVPDVIDDPSLERGAIRERGARPRDDPVGRHMLEIGYEVLEVEGAQHLARLELIGDADHRRSGHE